MRKKQVLPLLFFFLILSVTVSAQVSKKIDLKLEKASLKDFITAIENKTDYTFLYKNLDLSIPVSVNEKGIELDALLKKVLEPRGISYEISGDRIILNARSTGPDRGEAAQQVTLTVSGIVKDPFGEPVIGANVVEKGTSNGTVTDVDGNYHISVTGNQAVLQFSYLGYKMKEMMVRNIPLTGVVLEEDTRQIEEVVVIGYGSQKKETLTGAISNIKSSEILATTNSSLAQSLQGKVAGLQIRQNSGEPGDFNSMINVRGFGDPLYVIDGIARDGSSEFQRLNPQDIESISILKDASAAIYGLRAGNGVVIVTTKKGTKGKTTFSYDATFGWQRPTDVPKMATASQFAQMWNDASAVLPNGSPAYSREELQKYIDGVPGYTGTDWYDETMRKSAFQQQQTLSVSGGSEKVSYFISFGYNGDDGLLKSGDLNYKKYTLRSNLTADLTNNLKVEVFLSGRYDKKDIPGDNFFNIFKGTRESLPTETPYANNNATYPAKVSSGLNPVSLANRDLSGYAETVNKAFQSSATLIYTVPFIEGLSVKGTFSYDVNESLYKQVYKTFNSYTYSADAEEYIRTVERQGAAFISNQNNDANRVTLQAQVSYAKQIADDHNLSATLVFEQQEGWGRGTGARRQYDVYTSDQIDLASTNNQRATGMETQYGNRSYIGRFNYDYQSKYLIEFAFREDGSYRYNPDHQWGFFPVVSGGWRVSEEAFVKNRFPAVSNIKLRASYGLAGEDAGNPFQYYSAFSLSGAGGYEFMNGEFTTGVGAPSITNPNLTWYKSKILDIGVDLGLWNKLNIEFDVYQRDRKGLLSYRNASLPNTFGGSLPQENLNSDRVRGLDFAVSYDDRIGDFQYGVKANFNFARTMNRHVERGPFTNSMDRWRNGTENRWNDILWGYVVDGQFGSFEEIRWAPSQNGALGNTKELPGDYRYRDMNGDGIIDGNDMVPLFYGSQYNNANTNQKESNSKPEIFYGMTVTAAWKGFDLYMLFQGSARYSVRFNGTYAEMFAQNGNVPAYFFDRWHPADPYDSNSEWIAGEWPASRTWQNVGSMYLESAIWRRDASYLRCKSIELGYNIKSDFLRMAGIDRLRVYGNVYNVFTIADSFVKPFDPERLEGVYNAGYTYPLMRSFNIGFNLQF